jgi:hypothetical protein
LVFGKLKPFSSSQIRIYGGTCHTSATALVEYCSPEQLKDATGHASKPFERYFQNKKGRVKKVTSRLKELQDSNQPLINIIGE